MGKNTKIDWCHHTFSPWHGCAHAGSPGCDNCYARDLDKRFHDGRHWGKSAPRKFQSESYWDQPLKWNASAAKRGVRERVFCGSTCDVFETFADSDNDCSIDVSFARARMWRLVERTPYLDWLLLTKRPQLMPRLLPGIWMPEHGGIPDNVWIGATVENQAAADERIPYLLRVPARVRFLSCEPLLSDIDLSSIPANVLPAKDDWFNALSGAGHRDPQGGIWGERGEYPSVDWVIAGCETGPRARPAEDDWFRNLRDQCQVAEVPFFLKQMIVDGKLTKMPTLDSKQWAEVPT